MNICGIEKVSLVDFDGKICATLFCPGCNFACPYCHNGGILSNSTTLLNLAEVFDLLTKRKKMLDAVTVSGGEPTLQKDLSEFLKQLKDMGYAVKLDTNGSNFDALKHVVENKLVDYVAMDVKNSKECYTKTIGKINFDLSQILQSIEFLKQNKVDYEFRTTLVKDFHTQQSIESMATLLNGAKKLFLQKFKQTETCLSTGLLPVPKEQAELFAKILRKTVNQVFLRGY